MPPFLLGNMADTLQIKRSEEPGKIPELSVMSPGELAINLFDKKLFTANSTEVFEIGVNWANVISYVDAAAQTAYTNAVADSGGGGGSGDADAAYSNAISYADTVAGTAYSNAVSYADTIAETAYSNAAAKADAAYSNAVTAATTLAGTAYSNAAAKADTAYSNAVTAATTLAGTAYSNATSYADTVAGTAYSNAATHADTVAGTAYSNAVTAATTLAGTAYSNAISYADTVAGQAYANAVADAGGESSVFAVTQQFTGDGSTTEFTVTGGYAANGVQVFLNGVLMRNGVDVAVTDTSNVVFTAAPANNDLIDVYGASSVAVSNNTLTIANTTISNTGISIAGENVTPVTGFKNRIINGNFDFWQRGTSTSNNQYLADRWVVSVTGSTMTASQQSFTVGQTDVPGEPKYFHRMAVTTGSGASHNAILWQPIESCRTFAGQTATLSFWAKADATKNIAVEFYQNFGVGGSPSAAVTEVGVATIPLTTSWQKFVVTVDVPSISGKTLGTTHDGVLGILFWFDAGSDYNSRTNSLGNQSGTFDVAQVQFEAGAVATPFEHRHVGIETALCQRYYCKSSSIGVVPVAGASYTTDGMFISGVVTQYASGDGYVQTMNFPVEMRTVPSITTYPTNLGSGSSTGQLSIFAVTVAAWSVGTTGIQSAITTGFSLNYTGAGGAAQQPGMYYGAWTASAEF